ncbi:MAG: GxxExxY protein [Deltaproteobacteria bacterium]|jgi:hypothetical protein|nr:GxxExxY protein [Deltaproteobacteria bacterium]
MSKENKIAKLVVDAAYHVHTTLGPGLLESVYEVVLAHEIEKRGLADKKLGLLLNFGAPLIKKGIFRIVNKLEE